jgi:hypothetical protein
VALDEMAQSLSNIPAPDKSSSNVGRRQSFGCVVTLR